jgi:Tfp pilus assembly PilM family ATPase
MSVACDHPVAEALLDPFEAGGFEVCAIDAPLAAAARACANAFPRTGGMCALLDLGWQSARIAVLHDQVIVYTRSLQEAGLSKLVDSLIENLGVSREAAQQMLIDGRPSLGETRSSAAFEARSVALEHFEAMVRELSVSFSYAAHQYPAAEMQKLLVLGGGEIGELESYFEERLRFAVGIARPKELLDCAAESVCQSPAVVTAIGLAMHEESWA